MNLTASRKARSFKWSCCLLLVLTASPVHAADVVALDSGVLDRLNARPLGPANMGGRVVGIAVVESRPATIYVASASGGLWKTVNNGTTFTPVFDQGGTVSLGAVAVAASNPDVVWVGTGEANARNSVSWGDGVYKSTDAGKTWTNMGLKETAHIGRIVIHPRDPETVYVAALGRLWGPNKERGLYKTRDGGKTWEQVRFLDEDTGFIDLVMDPTDPETLYAAAYQVRRDAFSGGNPVVQCGPRAGLYKTSNGGKSWARMTNGLPRGAYGRCGLDICRKNPRILYAVVQTGKTVLERASEFGQPAHSGGPVETGGVFRSDDRGKTWTKLNDLCPRPFYFSQIRVDPRDDQRLYVLGISLHASIDGGRTFATENLAKGAHGDHHALWIDPRDSDHLLLGNDGGFYFSHDRGASWEHLRNIPTAQFYAVAVDMRKPYRVYGGTQDSGTWGGPSATRSNEGITPADWSRLLAYDGFHCQVDPSDPDTVYAEAQYGGLRRLNVRTGKEKEIYPRAPERRPEYRFNWSAPILLSPHDARVVYFGGNHVFRSSNRGDAWDVISSDLTRGRPGPSHSTGHTITTLAESPLKAGLLYCGSDDGLIHVRRGPESDWVNVSDKIPGVPRDRWVSRLECSHFAEGTAYLAIDRHRNDDRRPYLFKTTDAGATWKPIAGNLPPGGPVHVIREDPRNKDLLFAGTEFGLFTSLDGGASWHRLSGGLPTVAIHDLVVHPRDRDLVIATHGRGIYVMDIAPLQEWTQAVAAAPAYLFEVKPTTVFRHRGVRWPGRVFAAPNPPFGAVIHYYLGAKPAAPVRFTITDANGVPLVEYKGADEAGLHAIRWDLRPRTLTTDGTARAGSLVAPGEYVVKMRIGLRVATRKFKVEADD
jgi:photosystem II stability/assembly factor-like uncharacterized protein